MVSVSILVDFESAPADTRWLFLFFAAKSRDSGVCLETAGLLEKLLPGSGKYLLERCWMPASFFVSPWSFCSWTTRDFSGPYPLAFFAKSGFRWVFFQRRFLFSPANGGLPRSGEYFIKRCRMLVFFFFVPFPPPLFASARGFSGWYSDSFTFLPSLRGIFRRLCWLFLSRCFSLPGSGSRFYYASYPQPWYLYSHLLVSSLLRKPMLKIVYSSRDIYNNIIER